jgi:putative ABC transport system substrate-binding protein
MMFLSPFSAYPLSALNVGTYGKRVELLRELLPALTRIAGIFNLGNPVLKLQWAESEQAARSLGIELHLLDVRTSGQLESAFETANKLRVDALIVALDGFSQANRGRIIELASMYRLPAIYGSGEFVYSGGLLTYTTDFPDLYYRAATYVDKILKGSKPSDLPVQQSDKFALVINLKTAKALGITVPPSVLARADEVIE